MCRPTISSASSAMTITEPLVAFTLGYLVLGEKFTVDTTLGWLSMGLALIAMIISRARPTRLVACWDDDWRPAWRVSAVPSYKAHRVAEEHPGEAEADPTVLDLPRSSQRVHGAPRPRGILPDEHRVLRQARTLDVLLRHVADALPAARVLTGLRLGGRWGRHLDVDHAVLCGRRLILVESKVWLPGHYRVGGAGGSSPSSSTAVPGPGSSGASNGSSAGVGRQPPRQAAASSAPVARHRAAATRRR